MSNALPAALDARCIQAFELLGASNGAPDAERIFGEVRRIEPDNVLALEGLGVCAMRRGATGEAKAAFEAVLEISPTRAEPKVWLAGILADEPDEARAAQLLDEVLARDPVHPKALLLRCDLLLIEGDFASARRRLRIAAQRDASLCRLIENWIFSHSANGHWRGLEDLHRYLKEGIAAGRDVCEPLNLMMFSESPAEILRCSRLHAGRFPARKPVARPSPRRPGKIRLGYVSGDFRDHPVAHLFAGVLNHHDRERFELIAFSHGPASDHRIRRDLERGFDRFHDVSAMPDQEIAGLMAQSGIDIAVSLGGYTQLSRPGILAHRPAEIQVNYQGFPGTMAVPYVDYLIADRHTVPHGDERYYTEKIARLPVVYQPPEPWAQPERPEMTREAMGLPDEAFVFANFSATAKITPGTFDLWMRILHAVEGSVLWLASPSAVTSDLLLNEAANRGIPPARLRFCGREADREAYLARYRLIDVFLDTYPYGAHAMAAECLRAGAPIITRRGETFPSRVCAGLLAEAGLEDLACQTPEAYEARARRLATDRDDLAQTRNRVANCMDGPIFDAPRYVANLEKAFGHMVDLARAGQGPRSFDVDQLG